MGAGLPQLVGQMGKAKSYAERLFEFQHIGPLAEADARVALSAPADRAGVTYAPAALDEILRQTEGYAYFLQEWGKHTWNIAQTSPIQSADVTQATAAALADLDGSFFVSASTGSLRPRNGICERWLNLAPAITAAATSQIASTEPCRAWLPRERA